MAGDLLVNLYDVDFNVKNPNDDISIVRVMSPNAYLVVDFIRNNFYEQWASEVKASLYKDNPTCYVAVKKTEQGNKVVGFASYDATCKGFFGPIGVAESERKRGIGKLLLLKCLESMKNDGYGYAIIGSASEKALHMYITACNAIEIHNTKTIYERMF